MDQKSPVLVLGTLSATQEHFLKKFLVEACLKDELQYLSRPQCLEYFGPPFRSPAEKAKVNLPLLRFFFVKFVASFPFIVMNPEKDQVVFWRDTVQPFVESFNTKRMSSSAHSKNKTSMRHSVNVRVLRIMLLFYNSMLSSPRELEYLFNDHLKPSDQGKLDKISKNPAMVKMGLGDYSAPGGLTDHSKMVFTNDIHINIVAIDVVTRSSSDSAWFLNPLRIIGRSSRSLHCVFVLQFTRRSKNAGSYSYESHFISRTYSEFEALERALKSKYPGLMSAEIHAMPHRIKNDKGILVNESGAGNHGDKSPASTNTRTVLMGPYTIDKSHKYYGEKLRLALRGYLNTLLHKPEIAHCDVFLQFLNDEAKNFDNLSSNQMQDYSQRMDLEKRRLATQEEFQNHIARTISKLSSNFEQFKSKLLADPHQLTMIFEEIGKSADPKDISPLLTSFIEWSKLEVAATLYQMFLTRDNSSQWLHKCRKFHRLFPYRMCYGILKYTNPMKMMTKIVDLLLMSVPSFGSNSSNNLLSMIFIMLLDEDLQDNSKERERLLAAEPLALNQYQVFIERICYYVQNLDDLEDDLREESVKKESNLLLAVLTSDTIEPKLTKQDLLFYKQEIAPAHDAFTHLSETLEVKSAAPYVSLKHLWQLEIRSRDKKLLKQLWREPELTKLIKKFLTVFYQPLMAVMKKCDVHLVFLDFQNFVGDLLAEVTTLDEGDMYFTSPVEMFNRFKNLLDKYEGSFYRFMHDLHNKDDGKLFAKLIEWLESFLIALRTKHNNPKDVELDFTVMQPSENIDEEKFRKDLNYRIELILKKRLLLKTCLKTAQAGSTLDDQDVESQIELTPGVQPTNMGQRAIDAKWEELNDDVLEISPQDLGVSGEDVEEFNLMHIRDKATGELRGSGNARLLRQIAELDQLINEDYDSEIYKLVEPSHAQITKLLENLARPLA